MIPLGDSPIGMNITLCSNVLSPKGKDQVGKEKGQSSHRREVSKSNTLSLIDTEQEYAWIKCNT